MTEMTQDLGPLMQRLWAGSKATYALLMAGLSEERFSEEDSVRTLQQARDIFETAPHEAWQLIRGDNFPDTERGATPQQKIVLHLTKPLLAVDAAGEKLRKHEFNDGQPLSAEQVRVLHVKLLGQLMMGLAVASEYKNDDTGVDTTIMDLKPWHQAYHVLKEEVELTLKRGLITTQSCTDAILKLKQCQDMGVLQFDQIGSLKRLDFQGTEAKDTEVPQVVRCCVMMTLSLLMLLDATARVVRERDGTEATEGQRKALEAMKLSMLLAKIIDRGDLFNKTDRELGDTDANLTMEETIEALLIGAQNGVSLPGLSKRLGRRRGRKEED